jgi:hypothetical protein
VDDDLYEVLMRFHRENVVPQFERIDKRLDHITNFVIDGFAAADKRFDRVTNFVIDGFATADKRFDSGEREAAEHHRNMLKHFDDLYTRLGLIETEYHGVNAEVNRLRKEFDAHRMDAADVRGELVGIKRTVADLQERIAQLETELHDG